MRRALVLGGMLALFAVTCPVRSQTPLPTPGQPAPLPAAPTPAQSASPSTGPVGEAVIQVPEALVYSGPSTQLYATSKLVRGDRVTVLRRSEKDPSWLEIKPPQGSFSWINNNFIKRTQGLPTAIVIAPEEVKVSVKAGSSLSKDEPNVESTKVGRGTLVTVLSAEPHTGASGSSGAWLAVEPMPGEVRYLQASALERGQGIQTVVAQNPARQPGTPDPAVQRLSQQLETLTPAQKQQLITALGGVPAAQQPGNPNNVAAGQGYPAGQLVSNPGHPSGQNVALYNTNPGAAAPANPALNQAQWSSWGKLSKASFQKDGQQVYALLNSKDGALIMYAVPERGKTLEDYVGRTVALYGFVTYRDEYVRMHLMTVYYVSPPQ